MGRGGQPRLEQFETDFKVGRAEDWAFTVTLGPSRDSRLASSRVMPLFVIDLRWPRWGDSRNQKGGPGQRRSRAQPEEAGGSGRLR